MSQLTTSKTKHFNFKISKVLFFKFQSFKRFCDENNIDIISAKDPIAALLPTIIKKFISVNLKLS